MKKTGFDSDDDGSLMHWIPVSQAAIKITPSFSRPDGTAPWWKQNKRPSHRTKKPSLHVGPPETMTAPSISKISIISRALTNQRLKLCGSEAGRINTRYIIVLSIKSQGILYARLAELLYSSIIQIQSSI